MYYQIIEGERLTVVELGFWIFENIARDARLVLTLRDLVLEHVQELIHILRPSPGCKIKVVSFKSFGGLNCPCDSLLEFQRAVPLARQPPQHRHVVFPVVTGTSKITDSPFDVTDLPQHSRIDVPFDSVSVVKRQARVERIALEIANWIDVDGTVLGVLDHFSDGRCGFEVDYGHVSAHGDDVESSSGSLAAAFAGLIPG